MADKEKDVFAGTDRQLDGDTEEDEIRPTRGDTRDTLTDLVDQQKDTLSVQDSPLGYYEVDTDGEEETLPLASEELDDFLTIGTNVDAVMTEIEHYTEDDDILDDFRERQEMNVAGSDQLLEKLMQYNDQKTPTLSGGDLDADWEDPDQTGEETVGGTVATPDQDIVEELGEAVGIKYEYDEELDTEGKLARRDDHRWELNPDSADQDDEPEVDERDEI